MRIGGGAVSIADVTDRTARDLGFVRPFWLNEIRAGRAFVGQGSRGPTSGQFDHLQLFNPAASGITIIVFFFRFTSSNNVILQVAQHNTALTTLLMTGVNLLSGGTAAAGQIRGVGGAGALGTTLEVMSAFPGLNIDLAQPWHMELGEGEGLLTRPDTTNNTNRLSARWIEV